MGWIVLHCAAHIEQLQAGLRQPAAACGQATLLQHAVPILQGRHHLLLPPHYTFSSHRLPAPPSSASAA